MKVNIDIEEYDNGISLKWKDAEEENEDVYLVFQDKAKAEGLGNLILEDIKHAMDNATTSKLVMHIEYETVKS